MLRELGHLSIVLGISENLLLQPSFSYVKQEFSWVGTDDCKLKGRQWDREQRVIEVSVVSRKYENKGSFRMPGDEVNVVSGGLSIACFWSLQASEAVITFRRHSKEFRGIKDIFFLPLFLPNSYDLNVW